MSLLNPAGFFQDVILNCGEAGVKDRTTWKASVDAAGNQWVLAAWVRRITASRRGKCRSVPRRAGALFDDNVFGVWEGIATTQQPRLFNDNLVLNTEYGYLLYWRVMPPMLGISNFL